MIEQHQFVSFTQDRDVIRKVFSYQMRQEATTAIFSCSPLLNRKLVFAILLNSRKQLYGYWIDFDCTEEEYYVLARLIDEVHGTDISKAIMKQAYTWQVRAKHPDWPVVMEENAWKLWELSIKLLKQ